MLRKVERGCTSSNKFWLCCSFFIKLTTCHATNLLMLRDKLKVLYLVFRRLYPGSLGPWRVKGTEESTLGKDSRVPLMHHDPNNSGLNYLVKERKICFPM